MNSNENGVIEAMESLPSVLPPLSNEAALPRLLSFEEETLFGKIVLMGDSGESFIDWSHPALGLFVSFAGGRRARIVVLTQSLFTEPEDHERFSARLRRLGAKRVDTIELPTSCVDQMSLGAAVPHATGFLLIGNDPRDLLASLAGSVLLSTIRSRHREGAAIAGIRAGASVLGSNVIAASVAASSRHARIQPISRKGDIDILPGLNFLPNWVIDPAFGRTRSMDALLAPIAANPALLGIGLEEGVGVLANPRGQMTCLGEGRAVVVDGRESISDYLERRRGEIVSVAGPRLFVLGESKRFDPRASAVPSIVTAD
jgi:cyanophycinase